jgi:hypothetical protein
MTDPTDRTRAVDRSADPDAGTPPAPPEEKVERRAELLAEEETAGSDDPVTQARVILEESEERILDRTAAPGTYLEQRTSDETVPPPDA